MIISDGGQSEFDLYQNIIAAGLVFPQYGGVAAIITLDIINPQMLSITPVKRMNRITGIKQMKTVTFKKQMESI